MEELQEWGRKEEKTTWRRQSVEEDRWTYLPAWLVVMLTEAY